MENFKCPTCEIETESYTCPKCSTLLACKVKQNPFSSVTTIQESSSHVSKFTLWFLLTGAFLLGFFAYWRFVYYKPQEFYAPVVLSMKTISNVPLATFDNNEYTIPIKVTLQEGNFLIDDFYQFVPLDIKLTVQGFGITNVLSNYAGENTFEDFKKEFDVTADDMDTYLSNSFLVIFPKENLNNWGFVINVNEKGVDFVEERINKFNEELKKENDTYKYNKYRVRLIKIVSNGKAVEVVDFQSSQGVLDEIADGKTKDTSVNKKETDITKETKNVDKTNKEEVVVEATEEGNINEIETKYYLLVATSEDFLDQMKENSEGNLENISTNLSFVKVRNELPNFGQLFIFKQKEDNAWEGFVGRFVLEYPFSGLEKLLNSYNVSSLVFYSKDSKLKIVSSN